MSVNFVIAQIIGGVALIILMLSFQKNNKETLLRFQILSSMLYAIQYLFLDASTGCLMNFACMIRNVIFNKYKDRKVPTYWLGIVLALMILLSVISYNGVISLLPMIAVVLYSCALWNGNLKIVRIIEIISCSLFIYYNIKVIAITGLIATILELFAALIAVYKFDIKK